MITHHMCEVNSGVCAFFHFRLAFLAVSVAYLYNLFDRFRLKVPNSVIAKAVEEESGKWKVDCSNEFQHLLTLLETLSQTLEKLQIKLSPSSNSNEVPTHPNIFSLK